MIIFYWALGVAVVNSWRLRRRQSLRNEPCEYTLVQWQSSISHSLATVGKSPFPKKRGRPSLTLDTDSQPLPQSSKRTYQPNPSREARLDEFGHYPSVVVKQNRCKVCKTGFTKVSCMKCKVHLCLTHEKNCYLTYHGH